MGIFEKRADKAILWGWGHGRYLDAWSIMHFISGGILGALFLWRNVAFEKALFVSVALFVCYEIFEMLTGHIEDWQNSLLDVVLAIIGFIVAWRALDTIALKALVILTVINGILWTLGYHAYLRRIRNKK